LAAREKADESPLVPGNTDERRPGDFGVVVYDLETIHDAERGTYFEKGLHECAASEQITWKRCSQIIEFAAIDLRSGASIVKRCRPEFQWADVRSPAARRFAEDHGHDRIVQDPTLPKFDACWVSEVVPFLESAAGRSMKIAMIAHNGDAFDHFVLEKELQRLGLSGSLALSLHSFDPIRTLKQHYGQDYGSGGQLTLNALHEQHVHPGHAGQQHQALDDCRMLLEVLSHWRELSELLAAEIAGCFCAGDGEVDAADVATLLSLYFSHMHVSKAGGAAPAAPAGHELRVGATEFVPGVPWTGSRTRGSGGPSCSRPTKSEADLDSLRLLPQYQ